jgi:hypothetical protein
MTVQESKRRLRWARGGKSIQGVCFVCARRASTRVGRWIGHPEGAWRGWVVACVRHADPDCWGQAEEVAFSGRAHRELVRAWRPVVLGEWFRPTGASVDRVTPRE